MYVVYCYDLFVCLCLCDLSECLDELDGFFCVCVFFFKQKTAYEMRISDWSSDVCSSDLVLAIIGWVTCLLLCPVAWVMAASYEGKCREQIGRASCRERVCQYV